jgi:transposase InsO family protein
MGWKETCAMEERFKFIQDYKSEEWSVAELCRRFGISRKTGYKWLERYELEGVDGLRDQSRAPDTHPNQVAKGVEALIVEARSQHPTWGPVKLRAWLTQRDSQLDWPVPSTMGDILKRHGLTVPRKKKRHATPSSAPLSHAEQPNVVWSADFKGWFRVANGKRCDPFTLSDGFSRYLLRCQALERPTDACVRPVCEAAFREYGLPEAMRIDNGPPFASTALGGLSSLAVWWIKLGIRVERIEPGKPQQNGRHERIHRTLKQETAQPPAKNLRLQQERFDQFRIEYNQVRPHAALQHRTPAACYHCSSRPFPSRIPEVEYHPDWEVRKVRKGSICWWTRDVFVTRALDGEYVGIQPLDDRYFCVWFSSYPLGVLDQKTGRVYPDDTLAAPVEEQGNELS